MEQKPVSIRPFIGAANFELSRSFYRELGFEETVLEHNMSGFKLHGLVFYLQNAYVKDWVDNTMIFMEVEDISAFWEELSALGLPEKYEGARLSEVRDFPWGRVCYLHDPSGILWHLGEFKK